MATKRQRNRLYHSWWKKKLLAKKNNQPVYPEWETWELFSKWAKDHGYDDKTTIHTHSTLPFTPDNVTFVPFEGFRDYEYWAYRAGDPYEFPVACASDVTTLSEILKANGFDYTPASISSAISRNEERAIDDRKYGLIFERIDLTDYDEDPEPFERVTK